MCASCALVSRTLATGGVADDWSGDDEQPATSVSASAAATWRIGLTGIGGAHEIGPVPPAAAQSLEESSGVGEAVGFRLDLGEARLLVRLVGVENREIGCIAVLVLEAGEVEAGLGRVGRGGAGLKRFGVMLERGERVGDILECRQHRASILLGTLLVSVARRPLLVELGTAVENRREERGAEIPEAGTGAENLADGKRVGARVST